MAAGVALARRLTSSAVVLSAALAAWGAPAGGQGTPGDAMLRDFRFVSGESLAELRLHYLTLGAPRRDARGVVRNAVLVLHGTGGTGAAFLSANFGGELFGPGKLLDTARYYVILPDGIGHGGSSKPSNGMHAHFPRYTYDDMVRATWLALTGPLGVSHLRLIIGTSMGCMHAWVWGYTYPDFMDGLVPLACAPTQIAGRNRMMRHLIMENLRGDPAYQGGDYTAQPPALRGSLELLYLMSSAPLVQHRQAPTRDAADSVIDAYLAARLATTDANDLIYQMNASRDYDPSSHLDAVAAPVLAINSADDLINPPELGIMDRLMPRVKHGRYILIPISDRTRGHGTHSWPAVWGGYLKEFLDSLPQR
jgi:homoserine O-acetyltransferase